MAADSNADALTTAPSATRSAVLLQVFGEPVLGRIWAAWILQDKFVFRGLVISFGPPGSAPRRAGAGTARRMQEGRGLDFYRFSFGEMRSASNQRDFDVKGFFSMCWRLGLYNDRREKVCVVLCFEGF